jgi:hypothetical protein
VGEHSRRPQDSGKPWNLEEEEEEWRCDFFESSWVVFCKDFCLPISSSLTWVQTTCQLSLHHPWLLSLFQQ